MSQRESNRSQQWKCDVCKKVTEHRIGDRSIIGEAGEPSDWQLLDDTVVFRRERQCAQCGSVLATIELTEGDFERLRRAQARLRRLEAFRDTVRTALEALDESGKNAGIA